MEAEVQPLREAVAKKAELERAAREQLAQQEQEQAALERSTQERAAKKAELGARKTALQAQLQAVRGALEDVVGERKRLWRENEDCAAAIESVTAAAAKERRELGRLVRAGGGLMSRCPETCGADWRHWPRWRVRRVRRRWRRAWCWARWRRCSGRSRTSS